MASLRLSVTTQTSTMNRNFAIFALFVIVLAVSSTTMSSARYLPTRGDNSRAERIKNILRLLLELTVAESDLNVYPSSGGSVHQGPSAIFDSSVPTGAISKRSVDIMSPSSGSMNLVIRSDKSD